MVLNGGSAELVSVVAFICVGFLLCYGRITIGMATVGFMYCTKFMDPIYELNVNIGKVKSTKKIQEKLFQIVNKKKSNDSVAKEQIKAIQTKDVVKSFEQVDIKLPDLSFEYPNKYLVLGENGVGKSVLLKMLLGFMKPTHGEVIYDPKMNYVNEAICYVPQKPLIFEGTYLDNISIFGTYDCKNLEEYEKYFPSYLIEQIKNNSDINSLSGGEKQIICLLRALCSEKNVMVLDEPFSAMNDIVIEGFMEHLKDIDKMIIFVAHNMNQYTESFDEVYYLKNTRVEKSRI
jgi:ABC-type bacteriocin/lantibiotic exporter with double-glycine peptidase domain